MTSLFRHLRSWVVTAPVGTARYWLCLSVLVSRLGATRPARAKILVVALADADPRRPPLGQAAAAGHFPSPLGGAPSAIGWWGPKSDAEVLNEVLGARGVRGRPAARAGGRSRPGKPHRREPPLLPREVPGGQDHRRRAQSRRSFLGSRRNVAQLEGVEVHRLAVASRDGELDFYPAKQAWVSSTRRPGRDARPVRVRGADSRRPLRGVGARARGLAEARHRGGRGRRVASSRRLGDVGAVVGEFDDWGEPERRRRSSRSSTASA